MNVYLYGFYRYLCVRCTDINSWYPSYSSSTFSLLLSKIPDSYFLIRILQSWTIIQNKNICIRTTVLLPLRKYEEKENWLAFNYNFPPIFNFLKSIRRCIRKFIVLYVRVTWFFNATMWKLFTIEQKSTRFLVCHLKKRWLGCQTTIDLLFWKINGWELSQKKELTVDFAIQRLMIKFLTTWEKFLPGWREPIA